MGTSLLDTAVQLSGAVLLKYKKYVSSPGDAPDGVKVEQGSKGGYYYETRSRSAARETPKRPAGTPREQPRERGGVGQPEQSQQSARPDLATWTVKDNGDTMALYTNPDGSWKPEREKKHQEILASIFDGIPSVENPAFYLMGGGTAAGKSSILGAGGVNVPSETQGAWIDSDKIKSMLPEYSELQQAGNPAGAAIVHEESSYIAKRALRMAIERSTHTVLDGTGDSSLDSLKKKTDQYHQAGQRVIANYCSQPTEQSIKNSAARAARTGRVVPESILRGTHRDVSRILPEALKANLFDECNLYDTSIKGQPRLVLSHKDGKTQVHDPELWKVFLAKGEEGESPPQQQVAASLDKAKRYVSNPNDAPPGVRVQEGKRGGYFYETDANAAGPSTAPKVKRRGGKQQVDPFVQQLLTGDLGDPYMLRGLVYDAETASRQDDDESTVMMRRKLVALTEQFEQTKGINLRKQFLQAGLAQDPAKLDRTYGSLEDTQIAVRSRWQVIRDGSEHFSNTEALFLDQVERYCREGMSACRAIQRFRTIPPELYDEAEQLLDIFQDQSTLRHMRSRIGTLERFRDTQAPEDRPVINTLVAPSVGRLPKTHLALVNNMIVQEWGKLEGPAQKAAMHARMDVGAVYLNMKGCPETNQRYLTTSVTHEIGHVVHGALLRSQSEVAQRATKALDDGFKTARQQAGLPEQPESDQSWTEIKATLNHAHQANAPSDYSLTNRHEWFAEQYADYVYYPARIKRNFPAIYEAMKEVFGGTTYITSHSVPIPPGTDTEQAGFDAFGMADELDARWGKIP